MKHALNPISASAGRLAWRLVHGGVAACALVLFAAGSAHAQRRDQAQDRRDERLQQDPRPYERAPEQAREQRFDPRSFDSREVDQRRQQQMQEQRNAEARRSGRLTPDERRDLRRQINEAGMDLYPNSPPQRR